MASIVYTLSMPGQASWNGRWSGEESVYAIVRPIRPTKSHRAKCEDIAKRGPYSYGWRDGWRASISARVVDDATEVRRIRKASRGFCGYDWMVQSIERDGAIYGPDQPKQRQEARI